nr:hypothetical protein [Nocardia donostiensis]
MGDVVLGRRFWPQASVWGPDHHGGGTLGGVQGPQLLRAVGIAERDPVWVVGGMPEPHVDHAVALIVAVPVDPFRIGHRPALDFEGDFAAIGKNDADIGAAFAVGQPHLGVGLDHARLAAGPLGQHRLTGQVPQRLRMMPAIGWRLPGWMGEVRSVLPAQAGANHHGHFVAELGETGRAYQRPVTGEALALEFLHVRVGGIGWRANVLPAREIKRDRELIGETHSDTPCRIDGEPSGERGKATAGRSIRERRGFG